MSDLAFPVLKHVPWPVEKDAPNPGRPWAMGPTEEENRIQ